jgi:Ca-activated chloride channel family protein
MIWRSPQTLWLLASVPVAVLFFVFAWRRRRRALERFAEARLLPVLTPDLDERRRQGQAALLVAAIGLLALALAGPRWGFHWEEVRREGVDLIVALDTSRSMLAADVKPNRLQRAKLAVQDLIKNLKGDRVGLVAFAGSAFVQCPLTLDYEAFSESLRAVDVGIIPKGGTALADAVRAGMGAFEGRQGKYNALIVITDGEDHEGDVDAATQEAVESNVRIYTVGIGTAEGELIPAADGAQGFFKDRRGQVVKSRLDEDSLQKMATATGGAYVRASGAELGLDELYEGYIGNMEKRELSSTMERRFEERFQWPLAGAVACLLAEMLVGERRRTAARRGRTWFSRWRRQA